MKKVLLYLFLGFSYFANAQGAAQRIALLNLQKANSVESSRAGQIGLTDSQGNQRYAQYTEVDLVPISYVPTPTGNTQNYSEFVKTSNGDVYYIDWQGRSILVKEGTSVAISDRDWLEIGNNQVPDNIRDSIYTDNYVSVNMRTVWPNAELLVGDSLSDGNVIVAGLRDSRIAFYRLIDGNWSSIGQEGASLVGRVGPNNAGFVVQAGSGSNPTQPVAPFRDIFSAKTDSTIIFHNYPNTRNDTNQIVNFFYSDALGVMRSSPVSELPFPSGSGIDTLPSYAALRAYTGSSRVIYVHDFSYEFNGATYETLGGFFFLSSTGAENGGTILIGAGGRIWKRNWSGIKTYPEWWQVGSFDYQGFSFVNTATVGGIYNEVDRLNSASIIAGVGGQVELKKGKIYEVDKDITILEEQLWIGNNATIKRKKVPYTVVTGGSITGTTGTVTVTSTAGFRIGNRILLINTASPGGGQRYNENGSPGGEIHLPTITAINGNTFTVTTTFPGAFVPAASKCLRHNDFFVGNGNGKVRITDIRFDGNKDNDNTPAFPDGDGLPHDWRYFYGSVFSLTSDMVTIDNCHFYDSPSENIAMGKGIIRNCTYENLNGSFVHISSADDTRTGVTVENCRGTNSNIKVPTNFHGETVVTFSSRMQNCIISNCEFRNGNKGGIVGPFSNSSLNYFNLDLKVENSYFENFKTIFNAIEISAKDTSNTGISFNNNTFLNCGMLNIHGRDVTKNWSYCNIHINDNNFTNSRVSISESSKIEISNNVFTLDGTAIVYEDQFDIGPYSSPYNSVLSSGAVITVENCNKVDISSNELSSKQSGTDHRSSIAILVRTLGAARAKNDDNSESEYYFTGNTMVSKNTITGFRDGIRTIFESQSNNISRPYQYVNFSVFGNTVAMGSQWAAGGLQIGIETGPGMVVSQNVVTNTLKSDNQRSFQIHGIGANGTGNEGRLEGTMLSHNFVYNAIENNAIVVGTVAELNGWNNTFAFNVISGVNPSIFYYGALESQSYTALNVFRHRITTNPISKKNALPPIFND